MLSRTLKESLLVVKIAEGPNRQVRRMLARLGYKVRRLHRSAIGPIRDQGLKIGRYRYLQPAEVESLRRAAGARDE